MSEQTKVEEKTKDKSVQKEVKQVSEDTPSKLTNRKDVDATSKNKDSKTETKSKPFVKNKTKLRQRRGNRGRGRREEKEFETKVIEVRRVSRMYKGGRRMRLSVFVAVGDKKGRVGLGKGKGLDVRSAQEKAVARAKKNLVHVSLQGNTIPHDVDHKFKAAKILLKPASPGTGVIAGSSVRTVAELAGIKDLLSKILGTNNKITNAYATVQALDSLRSTRL